MWTQYPTKMTMLQHNTAPHRLFVFIFLKPSNCQRTNKLTLLRESARREGFPELAESSICLCFYFVAFFSFCCCRYYGPCKYDATAIWRRWQRRYICLRVRITMPTAGTDSFIHPSKPQFHSVLLSITTLLEETLFTHIHTNDKRNSQQTIIAHKPKRDPANHQATV